MMAVVRGLTGFLGAVALSTQLWSSVSMAQNVPADLCSSINTAGSGSGNFSIYQSHGLCGDFCRGEYAYAIMNYQECWCSDYTPEKSTVVDDDECRTKCPGYNEWCGGNDAYGYLQLGKKPKGTKGADSADDETSGVATVTATDGAVRTVTISPTNSDAGAAGAAQGEGKKGPSGGAIAGIVIGVVLLLIAIAAAVWFVMRRKRAQAEEDGGAFDPRSSNSTAFTGLGPDMKEASGLAMPGAALAAGAAGPAGNRNSRLLPVDPRMDPFSAGIYVRTKSRESINTLHDEHDYSRRVHQPRVLRATNPDPEE